MSLTYWSDLLVSYIGTEFNQKQCSWCRSLINKNQYAVDYQKYLDMNHNGRNLLSIAKKKYSGNSSTLWTRHIYWVMDSNEISVASHYLIYPSGQCLPIYICYRKLNVNSETEVYYYYYLSTNNVEKLKTRRWEILFSMTIKPTNGDLRGKSLKYSLSVRCWCDCGYTGVELALSDTKYSVDVSSLP